MCKCHIDWSIRAKSERWAKVKVDLSWWTWSAKVLLKVSHLFSNLVQGIAPPAQYVIQGKKYNMGYYLAKSIYLKWSILVQTIHDLRGPKKQYFARKQEACGKYLERVFGVLQSQFAIVAGHLGERCFT